MVKNTGSTKKANLLFKSINTIIKKNLAIKPGESLLIVYDKNKTDLAKKFGLIASKTIKKVHAIKIPIGKINGEEPKKDIAKLFLKYNTLILLTTKSLSHTKARSKATKKGIRIASMPGITTTILKRCIDINYKELKLNTKKLVNKLNKASVVIIEKNNHILEFSIKNRKGHGLSAGIYNKKGKWGNLPEGEAFIAPVEGTAKGSIRVDGSIAGIGKTKAILKINKGLSYSNNKKLESMIKKVSKKARNIAELGIGLNKKAKITGIVLEDEKVYGTCHVALGNNIGFGGKTDVPFHVDCIIKKPTIYLDNKKIMNKGKLVL